MWKSKFILEKKIPDKCNLGRRKPNRRVAIRTTFLLSIWLIFTFIFPLKLSAQTPQFSPSPSTSGGASDFTLTPGNVETKDYPKTLVNFSIERNDKSLFQQLEAKDVEATFAGEKVNVDADALQKGRENEPIKVLFMIDRSGSMKNRGKLEAAKESLRNFVSNLSPQDEVAIYSFDDEVTSVIPLTKVENRASINSAIESIQPSTSKFTEFYQAAKDSVRLAGRDNIKNVIFLSDGKEDTSLYPKGTIPPSEKSKQENIIASEARSKNVRFHTVSVGSPSGEGDDFVDYTSMKNISNSVSGDARLIDLTTNKSNSEIAGELKSTLNEIKKSFRFAYTLKLDLPKTLKQDSGELKLNFNVGDGKNRWQLPMSYQYYAQNGLPVFRQGLAGKPIFLETVSASLNSVYLSVIYLLLLLPLLFLVSIPSIYQGILGMIDNQKVKKAIVNVRPGSPLIGHQCPNEDGPWGRQFAFKIGDTLILCPKCATPHHLSCWEENQFHCMSRQCGVNYQIPASVMAKYNKNTTATRI